MQFVLCACYSNYSQGFARDMSGIASSLVRMLGPFARFGRGTSERFGRGTSEDAGTVC